MKVVAFGGWAVLSEHMSTTVFLIVRKSSRSKCHHDFITNRKSVADMHSAKTPQPPNEYTVLAK